MIVLFEKLIVGNLVRRFTAFLEQEGSFLYSQELATDPFDEPK
jgi:hypothetical protein